MNFPFTRMKPTRQPSRTARKPSWIGDIANQKSWTARFAKTLQKYRQRDKTIDALVQSERIMAKVAAMLRTYVDKSVTAHTYGDRRRRGKNQRTRLQAAVDGINAGVAFFTEMGLKEKAFELAQFAIELSGILGRAGSAYSTKRHGRDRDHTSLLECQIFLKSALKREISYSTLANLFNAAAITDGASQQSVTSEEAIRKNLTAFRKNNPEITGLIVARYDNPGGNKRA